MTDPDQEALRWMQHHQEAFSILLALAGGDRHGYRIMLEVEAMTHGRVRLGVGTLYRAIRQLLKRGLMMIGPPHTPAL